MSTNRQFPNPTQIAAAGQKIYDDRYRADFEGLHHGKYVSVNVRTGEASMGDTPEEALDRGRTLDREGLFHLVRVGFPSVYSGSSQTSYGSQDWIFGR
jgi:hypothetical protein